MILECLIALEKQDPEVSYCNRKKKLLGSYQKDAAGNLKGLPFVKDVT